MKTYKAPDNSLHCIDPEFAHMLPDGYIEIAEAEADAIRAALIPAPTVHDQIAALESTITPRRIREAVLGSDSGWLANMAAQIVALRAQL